MLRRSPGGAFIPGPGARKRAQSVLQRANAASYTSLPGARAGSEARRLWEQRREARSQQQRIHEPVWLRDGCRATFALHACPARVGVLGSDRPAAIWAQRAWFSSQPARPDMSNQRQEEELAKGGVTAAKASGAKAMQGLPGGAKGSASTPPKYVEENIKPEDLKPEMGIEDPRMEENSPSTVGGVIRRYTIKTYEVMRMIPGATVSFAVWATKAIISFFVESIRNPASLREKWQHIKKVTKEEIHHYFVGSKLLWSDIKTSFSIISRLLNGHTLTRRERRQLTRTTADIFRLVPFAFFVIVPFMELLLPVALKVFPNMLPSTFQDNLKEEENMKRELKMRLALAGFLKDTLEEITKKKAKTEVGKEGEASVKMLTEFVEKARAGVHISTTDINKVARLFKDELTLDNMSRPQLASMCVYMGLRPYGSDNFLRFQLRAKLRGLKEDDQRIVWEGIDNMTKEELREACRERGMRAYGLTQLGYRRQLQQWLNLSINKNVPISLLILSRAFTLDSKFTDPAAAVADSISSLDKDVVNEVLLDVASGAELRSPDIRARKLESIERQNELIEEERKREVERKKKEEEKRKAEEEKKKAEAKAAEAAAKAAAAAAAIPPPSPTAEVGKAAAQILVDTSKAMAAAAQSATAADVKAVQDAAHMAAKLTDSLPADGVPAPPVPKAERLPTEPVLTEAEIVSKPMPTLDQAAAATAAPAKEGSKKEEAAADATAAKGPELSVDEVKALRTLVGASSVEQEKSALAQLKADLQKAAAAKKAEAEEEEEEAAAVAKETVAATKKPPVEKVAAAAAPEVAKPEVLSAEPEAAAAEAVKKEVKAKVEEPPKKAPEKPKASKLEKSIEKMMTKVASMLDKLEVDIEKVETTIGDKLHMLDKDKDGVLSTAELTEVIQHVLKRHTSEEEALKIAAMLDKDADGVITVQELLDWIEHREVLLEELAGENDDHVDQKAAAAAAAAKAAAAAAKGAPATAAAASAEASPAPPAAAPAGSKEEPSAKQ